MPLFFRISLGQKLIWQISYTKGGSDFARKTIAAVVNENSHLEHVLIDTWYLVHLILNNVLVNL